MARSQQLRRAKNFKKKLSGNLKEWSNMRNIRRLWELHFAKFIKKKKQRRDTKNTQKGLFLILKWAKMDSFWLK
jgi:hypothetical protein